MEKWGLARLLKPELKGFFGSLPVYIPVATSVLGTALSLGWRRPEESENNGILSTSGSEFWSYSSNYNLPLLFRSSSSCSMNAIQLL